MIHAPAIFMGRNEKTIKYTGVCQGQLTAYKITSPRLLPCSLVSATTAGTRLYRLEKVRAKSSSTQSVSIVIFIKANRVLRQQGQPQNGRVSFHLVADYDPNTF